MSSRHNVSGAMIHSRARFCGAPVALNDIKVFKDFKDLRVVRSGRRLSGEALGCRCRQRLLYLAVGMLFEETLPGLRAALAGALVAAQTLDARRAERTVDRGG